MLKNQLIFSGNLSKYEYLTNKDLGYKPNAFEKAKFEIKKY